MSYIHVLDKDALYTRKKIKHAGYKYCTGGTTNITPNQCLCRQESLGLEYIGVSETVAGESFRAYNDIITINLLLYWYLENIFFKSKLLRYILSMMVIWFAIHTDDVQGYRYWGLPGETGTENYTGGILSSTTSSYRLGPSTRYRRAIMMIMDTGDPMDRKVDVVPLKPPQNWMLNDLQNPGITIDPFLIGSCNKRHFVILNDSQTYMLVLLRGTVLIKNPN